jgi:hypothetical protein
MYLFVSAAQPGGQPGGTVEYIKTNQYERRICLLHSGMILIQHGIS